jgi:hypothetical protein
LRPVALANVGFVEALREQCEALGYRSGARVDLKVGQLPTEDRLPRAAQETLFRIAQEALSNVARHSRATRVRIWIGEVDAEGGLPNFLLCIEDDGQGFNPESETSGMGLRNMRERIEMLDGTLKIESTPEHGTRIDVLLPSAPSSQGAANSFDMGMVALLALMPGDRPVFWIPLIGGILAILEALHRRCKSGDDLPWKLWSRRLNHYYLFFSFAIAFWGSPLFHRSGELTWGARDGLLLAATALALMVATTEAVFLLWRWGRGWLSQPKPIAARWQGVHTHLLVIAVAFLVTLPLLLVVDEPGGIGRAAMVASGLLYLANWVKLTFR